MRMTRIGMMCRAASMAIAGLIVQSAGAQTPGAAAEAPIPVSVEIDAARSEGALPPAWRFFGADEPNYATMKDGRKLMGHLGELKRGDVFFRTHNLLNTGDGT